MKAILSKEYGNPDKLEIGEAAIPKPRAHEVLVKVRAASINSWDWDRLKGESLFTKLESRKRPKFEIPGCDFSGIITEVGKDVSRFKVGDEVFGDLSTSGWGTFAEYCCAPEELIALKPKKMSFEDAAALPQAGVLALQSLRQAGKIKPGQRLLINGAGGGVGTIAIQLAKKMGAEITVVDRKEKLDKLIQLGADIAIDYQKTDFTEEGQVYDTIIDVVSKRRVRDYIKCLSESGSLILVGGSARSILNVLLSGSFRSLVSGRKMGIMPHKVNAKDLDILSEYYLNRTFVPLIDQIYPLTEIAEGYRKIGDGSVFGKVVIKI